MSPSLFSRTPLLTGTDPEALRVRLLDYFHDTFSRYESLFELLACDAAYYAKPIALRHPLIFYFGHTATFFVNKLLLAGLLQQRINPRFESMFAIGVDEMGWDDLNDAHYDWPSVTEVRAYRATVRSTVAELIASAPLALPIDWDHPCWVILMAIEHERIHLETSSVLIRQQRLDYVQPHPDWAPCRDSGPAPANALIDIPPGRVLAGKDFTDPIYGWDNEYGQHQAELPAFQASRQLVSNGEFRAFVEAGGYRQDRFWSEEGRAWRDFAQATQPTFWLLHGDDWQLRLLAEVVPMPWNWPVETNYHEAAAYCTWFAEQSGLAVRLPSEDEWLRLYDFAGVSEVAYGKAATANLQLDHFASSCPVDRFAHGPLFDVVGNVWQWTSTPIYPFDGFRVHPLYDDFSTPTFDSRHNLIKGGSWISCGNESRRAARYAFRRHFFQHAGFRYVVGEQAPTAPPSRYENDRQLSEYAEFHYGDEYFGVANFPKALAELACTAMGQRPARRALDLGCATGRASFELARHFAQVTGVDFSARFIQLGLQLARQGRIRYTLVDEGELLAYREHSLDQLGLTAVRDQVAFFQGDACNLKTIFSGYDLILAANLIDRLYHPAKFLANVHQRLNPGGLLVLATPCTWLEEHTPRAEWIGGFKRDGENLTTLAGISELLTPHFHLLEPVREVPFVIRETRRKFQHSLSQVSIWERLAE